MKRAAFLLIPAMLFLSLSACGKKDDSPYSEYRVLPLKQQISVSAGTDSYLAVKIEIPKNYYIYANPKGPGTGKPVTVSAENAPHVEFGEARYPSGTEYTPPGDEYIYIYKKEVILFIPFTLQDNAKGDIPVSVTVDALSCGENSCVPRNDTIEFTISISADAVSPYDASTDALFSATGKGGGSSSDNGTTSANSTDTVDTGLEEFTFTPQHLDNAIGSLLQAIIFGLIAGFILNFMPCVLPVVSLKVMSFVQHAGSNRRQLFTLGALFSLGILVSFGALATLAAFFGYNWGGLFQHQWFIIAMAAIVFILGLSMFEVFTIQMPSFAGKAAAQQNEQNMYTDAFMKGLLATLLATPCSGPFLGGTLAWALAQPAHIIFIIFMSIGAGMALPYLLLSMNPKFMRFIPKPGEWMRTFEQIMAFLLMFTVIYLFTILDESMILPSLTFIGFIAIAFWQWGKYGALFQPRKKRIISSLILVAIIVAGYHVSFSMLFNKTNIKINSTEFSTDTILENRNKGKVSIVKFTADWCPNCKLVESTSLNTSKVKDVIQNNSAELLVADITRKNISAELLLEKLGGHSIPFLAVFPAGDDFSNPYCLRDLYSEEDVIQSIEKASQRKESSQDDLFKIN